ncbi:HtaA domain-containing protein [Micromonospora sp. NBC_01813]|uniref:HtaA domain-containing protein n=1 Tax=Micromonospora sp. NBC_01813 TaxID=2975988 RepID=UPI002DDBE08A|nr:HtaA domain-containing protein [Micromonospora sp. NBC_01813]WSA08601.1 HtaA domain-containing protein [Micromonospora sp. NBC_01813]
MISTRARALGRRSATWAAVAVLGASTALVGASPAMAAPADITEGSLNWGFKASFRTYVSGGNGNPPIAASNGASINADGTFAFPSTGGSYDAETGETNATYGGTVVFSYPAHMFTITLANPTVAVTGGTAVLKADVELESTAFPPVEVTQATVATLTTSESNLVAGADGITGTDLAATLTEAGASAFNGFYAAGEILDPVSFTAATSGGVDPGVPGVTVTPATGVDPAGATITVAGSGFDPAANNAAGIYVSFGPKVDQHWTNAGVLQVTKWVSSTNEPTAARDRMNPDGSFNTTLPISARYTDGNGNAVDCTVTQCYVITFAARGSADRSQDTFTPVSFAAPAGGGDASQQIAATVLAGGPLTLSVAGSSVTLPAVANGAVTSGALNAATVSDLRGTNAGWSLVGQSGDFTAAGDAVIAGNNLGWAPSASAVDDPLVGATGTVTPGAVAEPGAGLGTARALCTSAAGASAGSFTCGAQLNLGVPASATPGDYTATLTLTLS